MDVFHPASFTVDHSLSGVQSHALRNLEIAHTCYTILRLPAQSRDSENAQRNLEIAQIPDCAKHIHICDSPSKIEI